MPEVYTPYIQRAEDIFRTSPKSADDFILQVSHRESPWSAGNESTCPPTICQISNFLRLSLDMIYPPASFSRSSQKLAWRFLLIPKVVPVRIIASKDLSHLGCSREFVDKGIMSSPQATSRYSTFGKCIYEISGLISSRNVLDRCTN